MKKTIVLLLGVGLMAVSCVSQKKFNTERANGMFLQSELDKTIGKNQGLESSLDNINNKYEQLLIVEHGLQSDTATLGAQIRSLQKQIAVQETNYNRLLADGSAEAGRMLRQLEANQQALAERERKVMELSELLSERERAISAIRQQVADALMGFEGKGLTVTQKGGYVYVSMDEKLLFKSGSFDIDPNGAQAVRDLAGVLARNKDIQVMVEGHTDDVPYRGSGQLIDNLDLSAKRATTVVRLLLENKGIEPGRVTASGRGESMPLLTGKTADVRQKNRRTEIILTPNLDKLMQLTESAK